MYDVKHNGISEPSVVLEPRQERNVQTVYYSFHYNIENTELCNISRAATIFRDK